MATSFLTRLHGALTDDPYFVSLESLIEHFHWKLVRDDVTDGGSTIGLIITCQVDKIDAEEFRRAKMLKKQHQDMLIAEWHSAVFIPQWKKLRCSFRLLPDFAVGVPSLCRVVEEGDEEVVAVDPNCWETSKEIAKKPFKKNGCSVKLFSIQAILGATYIEKNYRMLTTLKRVSDVENSDDYRRDLEERIVTVLNGRLQLERQFMTEQSDQEHTNEFFDLRTRLAGQSLEISWNMKSNGRKLGTLRGYRRENGFLSLDKDLDEHGVYFVETQNSGKVIQHLQDGKEYFYTFCVTVEEPLFAPKSLTETLFSETPKQIGGKRRIVASIRFTARAPTQDQKLRVEQALEKIAGKGGAMVETPERKKLNRAFEELTSFVEFDENLSQWEKDLIARIESKNYPEKERAEKIERLKLVVESLRVGGM